MLHFIPSSSLSCSRITLFPAGTQASPAYSFQQLIQQMENYQQHLEDLICLLLVFNFPSHGCLCGFGIKRIPNYQLLKARKTNKMSFFLCHVQNYSMKEHSVPICHLKKFATGVQRSSTKACVAKLCSKPFVFQTGMKCVLISEQLAPRRRSGKGVYCFFQH